MAIQFNFTTNPDLDISSVKERLHNALKGSPAYINSEIAICDGDNPKNVFYLIVGNAQENPDNDVTINIHFDSFPSIEETVSGAEEATLTTEE